MPRYNVIAKGFYDGMLYDPNGKRTTLQTEKPFTKKDMPSWVELAKEGMTPAQKAAATKAANKAKKDAEQDKSNDVAVEEVLFIDDKAVKSNNVESLG